ncbi:MAG: lipoate---protein ligase [Verrucomicrobiota bacterium]|jgi:lipoate-protein ligase A
MEFSSIASFELTLPSPAENLACDEALLEGAEAVHCPGMLRFWESKSYFAVLGYANKAADELDLNACAAHQIPILRRCSGGGTVLQGPGCLNYSLILPIDESGPLANITSANRYIMDRQCGAIARLSGEKVMVAGHTDLVIGGLKFSGNAQRRQRRHLLFHGTFLLDFDLALVSRFLLAPSRQPEYRRGRGHGDFLMRLEVKRDALQEALQEAWNARPTASEPPRQIMARLMDEKYSRDDWNRRW